jgi:hypothetical protein
LETYEIGHEVYKRHLELREDFAGGMRESSICVFDASLERKMIRKVGDCKLFNADLSADIIVVRPSTA